MAKESSLSELKLEIDQGGKPQMKPTMEILTKLQENSKKKKIKTSKKEVALSNL